MGNKFFTVDDDFESIIHQHFKIFDDISQEKNGWTNFVYKVKVNGDTYYFRFPRNDFFSDAIKKEYSMSCFIKNKISFKTPDLQLFFDNNRPYSMHKEIEGESLSKCYNDLTMKEKQILADDVCIMLKDFESIDLSRYLDYNFEPVSNFLDNLSYVSGNGYDINVHSDLKLLEKEHCVFTHGDFNPGNLILKNHKLIAVIDFAFAGISNEFVDISRIVGRCPTEFKPIFISAYKKLVREINNEKLNNIENLWNYVDNHYIEYIKKNHPSIILPTLV